MAEKKATVLKCTFTKEWTNPKGAIVYYHLLQLDNGDVGSVGTMEKNSVKIKEGTESFEVVDYPKEFLLEDGTKAILTKFLKRGKKIFLEKLATKKKAEIGEK